MTDLIYAAAADIYWDLGWRGIIPVDPADKGGVPKGFTGHDGIDVTRENLEWFVKSKPGYNIGLRQPDDVIGIDTDAYGKNRRRHTGRGRETLGQTAVQPPLHQPRRRHIRHQALPHPAGGRTGRRDRVP